MTPDKPAEAREREVFEKWCLRELKQDAANWRHPDGSYVYVQSEWLAYQFGRTSLATEAAQAQAQGGHLAALRVALENLDSMESLGPTTEAVVDAAQRWYLAAPAAAEPAPEAKA